MPFSSVPLIPARRRELEEAVKAFEESRDTFSRELYKMEKLLTEYGAQKTATAELLFTLPNEAKDGYMKKVLERFRFQQAEGRSPENTGLTGRKLRDWKGRDLSLPDTEGLRPQETVGVYDRITGRLREDGAMLREMYEPLKRWIACGAGVTEEVRRRGEPEKQLKAARVAALFLDAELFTEDGERLTFRKRELEQACGLLELVLG